MAGESHGEIVTGKLIFERDRSFVSDNEGWTTRILLSVDCLDNRIQIQTSKSIVKHVYFFLSMLQFYAVDFNFPSSYSEIDGEARVVIFLSSCFGARRPPKLAFAQDARPTTTIDVAANYNRLTGYGLSVILFKTQLYMDIESRRAQMLSVGEERVAGATAAFLVGA